MKTSWVKALAIVLVGFVMAAHLYNTIQKASAVQKEDRDNSGDTEDLQVKETKDNNLVTHSHRRAPSRLGSTVRRRWEPRPWDQQKKDPPGCWAFTHLQKAGGTTVKEILAKRFGPYRVIYDSVQWKKGSTYSQSFANRVLKKGWAVIAGGYPEAIRDATRGQCKWFTVFRHPISRLVSAYKYCQRLPEDQLCASDIIRASDVDLVTFAEHWGNFGLRQFVLNFIPFETVKGSGLSFVEKHFYPGWWLLKRYMDNLSPDPSLPDAALENYLDPVKEMLRHNYSAVGMLDEFDTTLKLFDAALDMPRLDWTASFNSIGVKNHLEKKDDKSKSKSKILSAEDELFKTASNDPRIADYIRLDLLLYDHALDVFHEQVASYGLATGKSS